MSLVARGLGSGLLVTRGLGTPYTVAYIVGDILLRVDRLQAGELCIELVRAATLQVDRHDDPGLRAARTVGVSLRFSRDRDDDLKF